MTPLRFAVVGDPIAHSKSPLMHGAAFRILGLPHTYEAIRATSHELPGVVRLLREGIYAGLNVTVPHKERVLSLADALDESARVAGAANTLVRRADGHVVAHNTDAPALAAELRSLGPDVHWPTARALVLGSGGAARAAVAALGVHLGVRAIAVRARGFVDAGRREAFERTAPCAVEVEPWQASPGREASTVAVVQATSAGMRGAEGGDEVVGVVAWDALPPGAVAVDVVYAPRDTPWLQAARDRGLRCDDGLGMLVRQGALAFALWLGKDAPLAQMRAAIE